MNRTPMKSGIRIQNAAISVIGAPNSNLADHEHRGPGRTAHSLPAQLRRERLEVTHVAAHDGFRRTYFLARAWQLRRAIRAEGTLGHLALHAELWNTEGTRKEAEHAADACCLVDEDDAVRTLRDGGHRARLSARRIVAVQTRHGEVPDGYVRIAPRLDLHDLPP